MALFDMMLGGFWVVSLGVLVAAFLGVRAAFLKVEEGPEPSALPE